MKFDIRLFSRRPARLACLMLLALPPLAAPAADPTGATLSDPNTWRRDDAPLTHAGIEELARRTGYEGGRLQPNETAEPGTLHELRGGAQHAIGSLGEKNPRPRPPAGAEYQGGRNPELLAIRGDKPFREHLDRNGLKLLDHIDDRGSGLQAVLVQDTRGSGRVYAVFRGTEFGEGANNEGLRDAYADAGSIGNNQYAAGREKLDKWAREHRGNLVVTGHSLGGAVGQRFVVDHPDAVREAVFFNSPGIDRDLARRVPRNKLPKSTCYVQTRDPVSQLGGEEQLPCDVVMVSGGPTNTFNTGSQWLAEHRGYMLRGGTVLLPKDYDRWQAERQALHQTASALINLARGKRWSALADAGDALTTALALAFTSDDPNRPPTRREAFERALDSGYLRLKPGVSREKFLAEIERLGPGSAGVRAMVEPGGAAGEQAAAPAPQTDATAIAAALKKLEEDVAALERTGKRLEQMHASSLSQIGSILARSDTAEQLWQNLQADLQAVRQAAQDCEQAAAVAREYEAHAGKALQFADTANAGFEFARQQFKNCTSAEGANYASAAYDTARRAGKSASYHYGEMMRGGELLRKMQASGQQGRAAKAAALEKTNAIAASIQSARNVRHGAVPAAEQEAALYADFAAGRTSIEQQFEQMQTLQAGVKNGEARVQPLRQRFDAIKDRWSGAFTPQQLLTSHDETLAKAESYLRAAQSSLKPLEGLPLCDGIAAPERAAGPVNVAMANLGLEGYGEGIPEDARACLARFGKPPMPATATAPRSEPPRPAETLAPADPARQVASKDCSQWPNSEAYWNDAQQQAKCRCKPGYRINENKNACIRQEANERPTPPPQPTGPNPLEALVQVLGGVIASTQGMSVPPLRQPEPGHVPLPAETRPVRTPATIAPAAHDDWFVIMTSAFASTHEYYRKYPECRYLIPRGMKYVSDVAGGKREIEASAAALRSRGHASVEVRYYADDSQIPRIVDQLNAAEKRGYDACYYASRRR